MRARINGLIAGFSVVAIIGGFVLALITGLPPAQAQQVVVTDMGNAYEYEAITVAGTAVGVTASKMKTDVGLTVRILLCTVETNSIRYRYDGKADPTGSEGHLVVAGGTIPPTLGSRNIAALRFIAVGSAAAVKCTFTR